MTLHHPSRRSEQKEEVAGQRKYTIMKAGAGCRATAKLGQQRP